ncbi:hypothetical protein QFC22_005745 [Naganishia vaughanmartiniae]|uniref:Uncharacterized protein n=1 Tax=Naganishia vaughanmartiniae TaxID=1424756 RepID=A0ACC2WR93_9TREE|nr:hypothetical protein QFC22_005745 [Naganishia vaughanmartiniae]
MSATSPPNALITSMISVAWAQLATAGCYCIWAMGLTHMKWKAGYMQLPVYGIIPIPYQLWTAGQLKYNNIYVGFLCGAFCLYDAVNLEEWLYWIYVVRAVRSKSRQNQNITSSDAPAGRYPFQQRNGSLGGNSFTSTSFTPTYPMERKLRAFRPGKHAARKTARWITSNVFIVWAALSVVQTVIHYITAFVNHPNVEQQTVRIFLTESLFNSVTAILSIILAWQFPSFIKLVRETGASSEVVSKLQFYHELNKWRIFFRVLFSVSTCILGFDAITVAKKINVNSLAADLLFQVTVLSFFFASICSWMVGTFTLFPSFLSGSMVSAYKQLYLPVQWNKPTFGLGDDAGRLRPQLRRYVPPSNRGRRTGLGLRPTDAASAAAVKALASPTSFTSPATEAYPYSAFAEYENAAERKLMMSRHSEQHRTLIDLLRERGTISHHERLPEDDVFEDEEAAEAYRVVNYASNNARQGRSIDTTEYGEAYQPGARRRADKEDETFATALGEPLYSPAQLPAGVEPVYGGRDTVERGPNINDRLPLVLQNFDSPAAGFSRITVPPKNVVINVSRDVEIDREDGDSSIRRMS